MSDDAYAEFRQEDGNLTTVLRQLADEAQSAEELVHAAEEQLAAAKAAYKDIVEVRIPAATDGMDGKFNLGDGRELQVKEEIRASIAGEKRAPAIKWLDDHEYGHIVKRQLILQFERGEEEKTQKVLQHLRALEPEVGPLVVKENYSVHPQTLVAWVKEQLSEGQDLPVDVFGIYRQRTAKIKDL